jgi:hypothetical protein
VGRKAARAATAERVHVFIVTDRDLRDGGVLVSWLCMESERERDCVFVCVCVCVYI